MSVQFIVGPSGSGKSFYINSLILKEADADKGASFFVLVPDQHTFNTQKSLTDMATGGCITNIDILSFKRLSLRLLEAAGKTKDIIDDIDKTYLIAAIGERKSDELQVLSKSVKKVGTQAQIKSLFSEFITYGITPQKLKEMSELPVMGEAFKRKAGDLLILYENFLERVDGSYYTSESIITAASDVIDEGCALKNATIVLDGFTGLTPLQYGMLSKMLPIVKKVYVTITLGTGELKTNLNKEALFYMSHEYKNMIGRLCDKAMVEIEDDVIISGDEGRFKDNEELAFLEKNLFREKNDKYPLELKNVTLSQLATPKLEVEYTAARIAKLLQSGVKAKEIAVVCADLSQYDYLVSSIFKRFLIPSFIDANMAITYNPLVEAIGYLKSVILWNFRREDVLGLLGTGLLLQEREDINLFDNYIFASGLRGIKKYKDRLTVEPAGFSGESLSICDAIRACVYDACKQLYNYRSGSHSVLTYATALFECIEKLDADVILKDMAKQLSDEGLNREAALYKGIYKVFVELLDKLVETLGEEKMSFRDFFEILLSGLAQTRLGLIPQGSDEVMVGDMERTRLDNRSYLFFLGASDANIPRSGESGGLLSQLERMRLLEAGCELADTDQMKQFSQRFYLYLALTKTGKKVYVSYPILDGEKKKAQASYLVNEIKRLYPNLMEEFICELPESHVFYSKGQIRSRMLSILHDYKAHGSLRDADAALLRRLMTYEKRRDDESFERTLDLFFKEKKEIKGEALYTGSGFGSISQFETYYECPFHYFGQYMLHLKERNQDKLNAIDIGDISHDVMYLFGEAVRKENLSFDKLNIDDIDRIFSQVFEEAVIRIKNAFIFDRPIEKLLLENLREAIRLSVIGMVRVVKEGGYKPKYFEKKIDVKGELPIRAKIDRADEFDLDGNKYLRIVDYKSSDKHLDITQLYYGMSMQLPLYLKSILDESGENTKPGAMLYYQIKDTESDTEKKVDDLSFDYKMRGLILAEPEAVAKATLGEAGNTVINGAKSTISEDDFASIMQYAMTKSKAAMDSIKAGEFTPAPCKQDSHKSCDYCPYAGVCGFDANGGDKYTKLLDKTMDDIRGDISGI